MCASAQTAGKTTALVNRSVWTLPLLLGICDQSRSNAAPRLTDSLKIDFYDGITPNYLSISVAKNSARKEPFHEIKHNYQLNLDNGFFGWRG